eukprot:gene5254-5634_t
MNSKFTDKRKKEKKIHEENESKDKSSNDESFDKDEQQYLLQSTIFSQQFLTLQQGRKFTIDFRVVNDQGQGEYLIALENNQVQQFQIQLDDVLNSLQTISCHPSLGDYLKAKKTDQIQTVLTLSSFFLGHRPPLLEGAELIDTKDTDYWMNWVLLILQNPSLYSLTNNYNPPLPPDLQLLLEYSQRLLQNNTSIQYDTEEFLRQMRILWQEDVLYMTADITYRIKNKEKLEKSQIRFKKDYFYYHFPYYNSLLLIIGDLDELMTLPNKEEKWNQRLQTDHKDRLSHFIPISFQRIYDLSNKEKKLSKFIHDLLLSQSEEKITSTKVPISEMKIDLHFHLVEIIFPYIKSLIHNLKTKSYRSHFTKRTEPNAHPSLSDFIEKLLSEDEGLLDRYGLLLTVEVKTKKLKVDVPGGKREIAETSLECAIRETFEEVGFDFEDLLKNHENATRVMEGEEWKLGQRFDADSMSCFPLFYKSLF